jgi:hypothetical protein
MMVVVDEPTMVVALPWVIVVGDVVVVSVALSANPSVSLTQNVSLHVLREFGANTSGY